MAVIALIQGLGERISGVAISRRDLPMAHARAAGNVDCPAAQMIAVGNPSDRSIMLWAAVGAGHLAPSGADLLDIGHVNGTAARLLHRPSPGRQRFAARLPDRFTDFADAPIGFGGGRSRAERQQYQCDPRSHHDLPLFALNRLYNPNLTINGSPMR